MDSITPQEAKDKILGSGGRLFKVGFTKANGEIRYMVARIGVKKGVKGEGLGYDVDKAGVLVVYSMDSKWFRSVKVDSIFRLSLDGDDWEVKP